MRKDLGPLSDIEIVEALVQIDGRHFLDLGCGPGTAARLLAERGASVVGIEPDPIQAARNREAAPTPGLTLTEGGAESLPQDSDSVDGVFFFRSLHHVPMDSMDGALEEARRVVRSGGFVLVLEPSIDGTHTALMRPFHDEDEVRTAAQRCVARAAKGPLGESERYASIQERSYESFEALVARFAAMSFNSITAEMVDVPAVRQAFEAARGPDGHVFHQPLLIDVFRV
ncbi:MAG: class I SAM-dependent methyltransferase [Polyangiales bacterium]